MKWVGGGGVTVVETAIDVTEKVKNATVEAETWSRELQEAVEAAREEALGLRALLEQATIPIQISHFHAYQTIVSLHRCLYAYYIYIRRLAIYDVLR